MGLTVLFTSERFLFYHYSHHQYKLSTKGTGKITSTNVVHSPWFVLGYSKIFTVTLSLFAFHCCDKNIDKKSILGKRSFTWLSYSNHTPSLKELKAGTWKQEPKQRSTEMLTFSTKLVQRPNISRTIFPEVS